MPQTKSKMNSVEKTVLAYENKKMYDIFVKKKHLLII